MSDIRDDELILHHYGELPPRRCREIDAALASSPALASRRRKLQRLLAVADHDAVPRDAELAARVWQRLQPRLDAPRGREDARGAWRHRGARAFAAVAAVAAAIVLAVVSLRPVPSPAAPAPDRVLTAYVASHLRRTEELLLRVVDGEGAMFVPDGDDDARALADDNRLYASVAARRGHKALAGFLETLDPLLTEAANGAGDGLRDYVRRNDLLFRVRVVEARLQSHDLPARTESVPI